MMETTTRTTTDEMQTLAELLATVLNLDKPLREKWIDYGTGLAEGYKMAMRSNETERKEE